VRQAPAIARLEGWRSADPRRPASGDQPRRAQSRGEAAIAENLDVQPSVVVLSRAELAQVVADNPFPHESNPKHLHAVLRGDDPDSETLAAIAAAQRRATEKGSPDESRVVGRTLFLRTPDGMGRSELAAQLARSGRARDTSASGTARNWATVTKLLALLDA